MNPVLRLEPMTLEEYRIQSQRSFESFVRDASLRSGEPTESVRQRVGGPASEPGPNDLWYVARVDGQAIGYFWVQMLSAREDAKSTGVTAFGYDIFLDESARGKGLGRELMLRGRELLRARGVTRLRICVFEDNVPARRLYQSLGFREVKYRAEKKQYLLEIEV